MHANLNGNDRRVYVNKIAPEIPSNIILKKFARPSHYVGIIVCGWGIVMTLTGVVQNYGGLIVTRLFLGLFE